MMSETKNDFPVLVQLAPTDDELKPDESIVAFWLEKIIKEKTAKLQADLASAQERIAALEAENVRLRKALQPFADLSQRYKEFHTERPNVMFKDYFRYNEEAHELLHNCIDAREALQAKEAK